MKNKFGLSRHVPEGIKRQLRQEAHFGCVVCGNALIIFEHLSDYVDVKSHNPEAMVCICAGCHDKVTRGIWTKEKILEAKQNPKAKQVGYSNDFFDAGKENLSVCFGKMLMKDVVTHLRILDRPVFWISPPKQDNPYVGINAVLRNDDGEVVLEIVENEWRTNSINWDAKVEGKILTFRDKKEQLVLKIRLLPRKEFNIEYMKMYSDGFLIMFDNNIFSVTAPNWKASSDNGGMLDGCEVGFQIVEDGLKVGYNCRSMSFSDLRFNLLQ